MKSKAKLAILLGVVIFAIVVLILLLTTSQDFQKEKEQPLSLSTVESLIKDDIIKTKLKYRNQDFRFYESTAEFKEFLDSEKQKGELSSLVNTFQIILGKDSCFDTKVIVYTHTERGVEVEIFNTFIVGDKPLNDYDIKQTFSAAYEQLYKANIIKPHSRYCVLRAELGPVTANPQYIFGNIASQVYVDAITGEVSGKNPVYPNLQDSLSWPQYK